MPLPNVSSFVRDQGRNPIDLVGNAIRAFTQVSQEFRATRAQNLAEQKDARQAGDQIATGIQSDRLFGEQLTDIELDRQEQMFRMMLAADDQKMQRQRFGLDMELAGLRLDQAKFQRDELQPLELEGAKLGLSRDRLALQEAKRGFETEQAVLGQFEKDFSLLRSVQNGKASLPADFASTAEAQIRGNPGLTGGTALADPSIFPKGSIITNGSVRLIVTGESRGPGIVELPHIKDEDRGAGEFAIAGQLLDSEIPTDSAGIERILSNVRPAANFDQLKTADRFRATASFLDDIQATYGGRDRGIDMRIQNARRLVEANPQYRALKATGALESRPEQLQRRQQVTDALLFALPFATERDRQNYLSSNPGIVDRLMRVPPSSLGTAIRATAERAEPVGTGADPAQSAGFFADLRDAQKEVLTLRGEVTAQESNPAFQLQLPQTKARLAAAEQYLQLLQQQAGGGSSPALPAPAQPAAAPAGGKAGGDVIPIPAADATPEAKRGAVRSFLERAGIKPAK